MKNNHQNVDQMRLVVIDPQVESPQQLIAGLAEGTTLLLLDSQQDSIEQITAALKKQPNITSLHLVCHGSPGYLYLGNTHLSLATLEGYATHLKQWVNTAASVFIYGCQVAAGKAGKQFLQRWHQLTRMATAASSQHVGSSAKGGNWHLDYHLGEVVGDLAFLPAIAQTYPGTFEPTISLELTPTVLVESQSTLLTFTFRLSEPPPANGVTVTLTGNVPQSLNQLDVFDVRVSGGDFPVPDFDNTGFDFTIREQVATVSSPIFADGITEGAFDVTYSLQSGSGYTVDGSAGSATVTFADTPADIPTTPPPSQPPVSSEPAVSLTANPFILTESEGTATTLTFNLSESPPPGGITIRVDGNLADGLSEFDLNGATVTGGSGFTPDANQSGFALTITEPTATLRLPVRVDTVAEASKTLGFSLVSGQGYTVNPQRQAISLLLIDPSPPTDPDTPTPPTDPDTPTPPTDPIDPIDLIPPLVELNGTPELLVEAEQTVATLTLSLSKAPPSEGLTVFVSSDVANALGEFDLDNAVITGGRSLSVNEDLSGFALTMTEQTATIDLPILNDGFGEGLETLNFFVQPGEGYFPNPENSEVSFSIEESLTLALTSDPQTNILQFAGSPEQTTNAEFSLVGGSLEKVVEVGLFEVDDDQGGFDTDGDGVADINPGDENYQTEALSRGRTIVAQLPNNPFANPSSILGDFVGNQRVAFYAVVNNTTEGILSGLTLDSQKAPESRVVFGSPLANNGVNPLTISQAGDQDRLELNFELSDENGSNFDDLRLNVQLSDRPSPFGRSLNEPAIIGDALDLRNVDFNNDGIIEQEIAVNFTVSSDAAFDNFVGFYQVDDESGQIGGIQPGELGYAEAAIQRRVVDLDRGGTSTVTLSGGDGVILAPFLIANGTVDDFLANNINNDPTLETIAYFNYREANPDSVDHIISVGTNTFGFEDLFNGGDHDFNDMIIDINFLV
ncbi:MAG: DUF4347 domain-containing protein [Cyanobacteria bacterium P01_G01_bin.49]